MTRLTEQAMEKRHPLLRKEILGAAAAFLLPAHLFSAHAGNDLASAQVEQIMEFHFVGIGALTDYIRDA
jgi:hypothetical protein